MHAFLRFRRLDGSERFVAWFEPDWLHPRSRRAVLRRPLPLPYWAILTPVGSAWWNREMLVFGPPARRDEAPGGDAFEAGWRSYYESVFNPAWVNPAAMRAEMPKKY